MDRHSIPGGLMLLALMCVLCSSCKEPTRATPPPASPDAREVPAPAGGDDQGCPAEPSAQQEPAGDETHPSDDGHPLPITQAQREIFWNSPEEPDPEERFDERHYVHSNEQHHELFLPYIHDVGGGYVGVASDQNYTLAAQARSRWVWLMDYDIVVVRMHRVVRALVLQAPDAQAYMALWTRDRKDRALEILQETYSDDPDLGELEKVYKKYRAMTEGYNTRVFTRASKGKCAFWLHDAGSYDYIRALHQAGRIRALRGNLLETTTLRGIGQAARDLDTHIRVVYLSDAESFFAYSQAFRDNFSNLPMDEKSAILRTVSGEVFGVSAGDYQWHYNIQSGLHFQGLLINEPPVPKVRGMIKRARKTNLEGVSVTGIEERDPWQFPPPPESAPGAETPEPPVQEPVPEQDQTPEAEESEGHEPVTSAQCGDVPEGMACIPEGWFMRGADDSDPDRRPYARVWVSSFLLDRTEVTNERFNACIKAKACQRHESYRGFMGADQPAVGITWHNAYAYCRWAGKRLPTEAEWEKAARGPDGDLYPWGDQEPTCQLAHFRGCEPDVTLDVGSLPAGHYGLFDMAGNGYEWVQDWWSPCYDGCEGACGEDCTQEDPKGPCDGLGTKCKGFKPLKVLRGGSWYWPAGQLMASWRRRYRPDSGEHRLSVRCAMDVSH